MYCNCYPSLNIERELYYAMITTFLVEHTVSTCCCWLLVVRLLTRELNFQPSPSVHNFLMLHTGPESTTHISSAEAQMFMTPVTCLVDALVCMQGHDVHSQGHAVYRQGHDVHCQGHAVYAWDYEVYWESSTDHTAVHRGRAHGLICDTLYTRLGCSVARTCCLVTACVLLWRKRLVINSLAIHRVWFLPELQTPILKQMHWGNHVIATCRLHLFVGLLYI